MDPQNQEPVPTAEPQTTPNTAGNQPAPTETPTVTGPTVSSPVTSSFSSASPKKKLFGKIGIIPAAVIGAVLLVGGSAAGYFGIIVPNKPENVLKAALENTAKQTKTKFEGKFSFESTDPAAEVKAVNVTMKGEGDSEAKEFQSEFEMTASGVKLPFEVRKVDTSLYVKVGDLSTIKSLATAAAPEYGAIIDVANEKLANQWIEFDETLLKQAEYDCTLNTSFALTAEDIKLLQQRYQEVPFTTVKNTSSDTVNGRAAYKYELELDDNKAAEYVKGLDELSAVKKLKECTKEEDPLDSEELADDDITPITIWVDKSTKTLSKFVMNSTKQDEEKSQMKGSFEMTFSYGEANVVKPEGARPAMEVLADLQALLMGGMTPDDSFVEGVFDIQDFSNLGL